MEKNIYDFIKNTDAKNILLIKQSDKDNNHYDNNFLNENHVKIVLVNENSYVKNIKNNIIPIFDLIINDTENSSEELLKIIDSTYDENPLIIYKNVDASTDLSKYNLETSPISENYTLLYNFNFLNEKYDNTNHSNYELDTFLNDIYLKEYENNKSFSSKISSKLYPLSFIKHSSHIGGMNNFQEYVKGYQQLRDTGFLNVGYYLRTNNIRKCKNVYLDYIYTGSKKGYQPNEEFTNENYLEANPDLNDIKIDPAIHYLLYGKDEKREINTDIKGVLQRTIRSNLLHGWIAKIGDCNPLTAKVKIDDDTYHLYANLYREDLDEKKINHGEHGFELEIPKKYHDQKDHIIRLYGPGDIELDVTTYNNLKNGKKNPLPIKGLFQSTIKDRLIQGWIAEIGNDNPINATIRIEDRSYPILADIPREDLKRKNINEGNHGFEFIIPNLFVDGQEHIIQLVANNQVISEIKHSFNNFDYENNIERFFANSMTSPEMILPPSEPRKKVLSVMDNIVDYLMDKVDENPLVSVIMPVYNREELIENAIDSVLNQSYKNIELIIIDDKSTDNTPEIIEKIEDKRIRIIYNKENLGISRSRNIGLTESRGKYIMYLDSDNDWEKDYVKATVGAFSAIDDADAVYSGQYVYEKSRENLRYIRYGTINKGLLSNRNYVDLNCFSHTRKIFEEFGGFDESLERFVDWDLILKYMTYGKIYSIPVILSNYYNNIAENSVSNNVKLLSQSEDVLKKHEARIKSKEYDIEMKHGVSVIIPSYESLDDLKECLNSLFDLDAPWMEIIVVDNDSQEDVIKYLVGLKNDGKIKLILNEENMGFTYAVNQAIAISEINNDILLLNNDAIVTENAIELLQKAAYELDNCGMTVPQQILPANTRTINIHVPYAQKDIECDVNLSNHHKNIINIPLFHNGEYTQISFAPFFCVYIKRETYNMSNGLDEEHGRHFRSDMIFCNYVRTILGQKIYHVSEARVYHKLQQATSTLKEKSEDKYDLLYVQNRWSEEEQEKYGYKTEKWDFN
ncbi:MAG: hypothetical protein BZ138_00620 [Methanosphaera sp. rholeuAM270]|nr:MAG: hypothetical protein BZ138_00620 [Methanosphaera sp. rholeuAM270]